MKNRIYIGDNLDVLKTEDILSLAGKIDFVYIDPPYNTNNKTLTFNDDNDDWTIDVSKRIETCYNLLSDKGCIFISIDDNELSNLLYLGYKIFKKENYVGLFITKQAQRSNAKHINTIHEYVVCFAKNKKKLPKFYINRLENPAEASQIQTIINKVKKSHKKSPELAKEKLKELIENYVKDTGDTWIVNYSNIDDEGNIFFAKDLSTPGKPNRLDIDEINLHLEPLKTRGWSSKEKIMNLHNQNRLCFKKGRPYEIEYIHEATNNVSSVLNFYSRQGTNDLKKLGLDGLFDTPKPVELIKYLIRCSQHKDSIILDFYAGSGTTAQAVYEINKESATNHKYILIQIDEKINKKNESYSFMVKRGYSEPTVDQAMLLRIDTFLDKNNIQKDYVLTKHNS